MHLPSGFTFELYNVKHVPKATKHLLSVGKAHEDGIDIVIKGHECYLEDSGGQHLCHAEVDLPYYWVTDLNLPTSALPESLPVPDAAKTVTWSEQLVSACHEAAVPEVSVFDGTFRKEVDLWHRRLGHIGPDAISRLAHEGLVEGFPTHLPKGKLKKYVGHGGWCEECC